MSEEQDQVGLEAIETQEIPISPALLAQLAPFRRQVTTSQDALNKALEIALAALGVDTSGKEVQVEIRDDPPRFIVQG